MRKYNKGKKFWISFMGNSPLASLNCIWLAYERDNFLPDKVVYFATPTAKKQLELYMPAFKDFFTAIRSENTNNEAEDTIVIVEISETVGLSMLIDEFSNKITECKNEGIVAVDVTPGRKIMSIAALEGAKRAQADKIYYLHLLDESYRDLLVDEIPCVLQTLYLIDKEGKTKLLRCEKNVDSR